MIYNVLCTSGLALCSSVREGVKQCCVSVVCPCRREEAMPLPALQSDFTGCSEQQNWDHCHWWLCVVGASAADVWLRSPAQDIPFVFHALAVVTALWPAVWPVGCHPWKGAFGAWGQIRLIGEQSYMFWNSLWREKDFFLFNQKVFPMFVWLLLQLLQKSACESQRPVLPLQEPVGELYIRNLSKDDSSSTSQSPGSLPSAAIP